MQAFRRRPDVHVIEPSTQRKQGQPCPGDETISSNFGKLLCVVPIERSVDSKVDGSAKRPKKVLDSVSQETPETSHSRIGSLLLVWLVPRVGEVDRQLTSVVRGFLHCRIPVTRVEYG
jgi:hypothetical protein